MVKSLDDTLLQSYLQMPSAAVLLDLNFGFARARILNTALELRLFTAIKEGSMTATALASATQCSIRGIERLLSALVGIQLLSYQQDHYALTPLAAIYLVEGQPGYIGEHLREVMREWDTWSSLTEVVRSGRGKHDIASPGQRGRHADMFAPMFPVMFPTAWQVAGVLELEQGRVLDLAAGSGAWSIALALRQPHLQIIVQDEPELLEACQRMVERFKLQDRMIMHSASINDLAFPPASFDLILLNHTSRFIGAEKIQELLCACYQLLKPHGSLLLADLMLNGERMGPPFVLVVQLSLLLNTRAGDIFTLSEYRTWLRMAGFQQIKNLAVQQGRILLALR